METLTEEEVGYISNKFTQKCRVCYCVKPPRAHHCSRCGRCVFRMDHHCIWVANCVGQRNMKFFLNFVFYMGIYMMYSFLVFGVDGIKCAIESNIYRTRCQHLDSLNGYNWFNFVLTAFNGFFAFWVALFCFGWVIYMSLQIK